MKLKKIIKKKIKKGIDFKIKFIEIENKIIKLIIWDTLGQERFKILAKKYYINSMGIILTYSITDRESFMNIVDWMKQIDENAPKNICKILVGNKSDLEKDRQIQYFEGEDLAKFYGIDFYEVSSKMGIGVSECLIELVTNIKKNILDKMEIDNISNSFVLHNIKDIPKNSKGCC